MRTLLVIGIGMGNPEQLTQQAIAALRRVEVVFLADKGPARADLATCRKHICERYLQSGAYRLVEIADPVRDPALPSYEERVQDWHARRAELYARAIAGELGEQGSGAFLVWGDPSLYDSTLRILEQVRARGVDFAWEVIPGVSSLAALAASHRIVLNRIGASLVVTTGARLLHTVSAGNDDVVVLLDGECSWQQLDPDAFEIFWGAYLGTPRETLARGRLRDVSDAIAHERSALRAEHGWIFDIYLIRRLHSSSPSVRV
jgi:precorrin-6A synthase